MASVLEHWADEDKPASARPPTWGNLSCPTGADYQPQHAAISRQNFQDGVMTRQGDSHETWMPDSGMPESRHALVNCPVNVPKEARPLADHPNYKAKMNEFIKIHGAVLSSKPCKNPPVRVEFREATIPLKQGYQPARHRNLETKREREQAIEAAHNSTLAYCLYEIII